MWGKVGKYILYIRHKFSPLDIKMGKAYNIYEVIHMLNISEMASLLRCSENRLLRNTKYYMQKIEDLGYKKVGKGKGMLFEESEISPQREAYLILLDLIDNNETLLNNMLECIEEVIEMCDIKTDIEELAERLQWSESKTRQYMKALDEANILKATKPKYCGVKFNGEKEEISFELYDEIMGKAYKASDGAKDISLVRSYVYNAYGYKSVKKEFGWDFTDKALECSDFMSTLLLALDYKKQIKKKNTSVSQKPYR